MSLDHWDGKGFVVHACKAKTPMRSDANRTISFCTELLGVGHEEEEKIKSGPDYTWGVDGDAVDSPILLLQLS